MEKDNPHHVGEVYEEVKYTNGKKSGLREFGLEGRRSGHFSTMPELARFIVTISGEAGCLYSNYSKNETTYLSPTGRSHKGSAIIQRGLNQRTLELLAKELSLAKFNIKR